MTLSFDFPADHGDSKHLISGNSLALKDLEGNWQLYNIVSPTISLGSKSGILKVYAEHRYYDLRTDPLITKNWGSVSASFAVGDALVGTRFQRGIVTVNTTRTTSVLNKNPLYALNHIARTWGGELRFRVDISDTGQLTFFVDLLSRRGAATNKRQEFGYDLTSLDFNTEVNQIYTAMYGYGSGTEIDPNTGEALRIDFSSVEWSKANGDPTDKPLGQEWVGDDEARIRFGKPDGNGDKLHRFGKHEGEARTPEEALLATWQVLNRNKHPKINISGEIQTLEHVPGFEFDTVRLGDTNYVIARHMGIEAEARVIRIEWKPKQRGKTKLELGNYRPRGSDVLGEIRDLKTAVESKSSIWDEASDFEGPVPTSWLEGVIDVLQNEVRSSNGFVYFEDPDGISVYDKPKDQNPTEIIRIVGGRIAIADSKLPNGEWDFKTFGTAKGFTACLINTGELRTELVRIVGDTNFYWDGAALFSIDPQNSQRYIRFDKEGLRFTQDGGATFDNALTWEGLKVGSNTIYEEGYNPIDKATPAQVTTITNDTIRTTNVVAENLKVKSANIEGPLTAQSLHVPSTPSTTFGITIDRGVMEAIDSQGRKYFDLGRVAMDTLVGGLIKSDNILGLSVSGTNRARMFLYDDVVSVRGVSRIAIGDGAFGFAPRSITIGQDARVHSGGNDGIAMGYGALVHDADFFGSIAIGRDARAMAGGVALGRDAIALGTRSVAIGRGTHVVTDRECRIGSSDWTTIIPGRFHVWGDLRHVNPPISSNSANTRIGSSDRIFIISSSRKNKQDIKTYDKTDILKARPVTFRDKNDVENNGDSSPYLLGFIAEEMHEAGLTELVEYNEDGEPQAVNYDRVSAALLSVIKEQHCKIKQLEQRLQKLEEC